MKRATEREVWKVEVQSSKYEGERMTIYVFASSAAKAEKRALEFAAKDGDHDAFKRAQVTSASFAHYVV